MDGKDKRIEELEKELSMIRSLGLRDSELRVRGEKKIEELEKSLLESQKHGNFEVPALEHKIAGLEKANELMAGNIQNIKLSKRHSISRSTMSDKEVIEYFNQKADEIIAAEKKEKE